MQESEYAFLFSQCPGMTFRKLVSLKNYFGNLADAWTGDFHEWNKNGVKSKLIDKFVEYRHNLDIKQSFKDIEDNNIGYITFLDDKYPELLKEIHDPPITLFYQGNIDLLSEAGIAVVGTRGITDYGKSVLVKLIAELVRNGLVVVSGLAYGIDSRAHFECLENKGKTVAVLGGGLNVVRNTGNHILFKRIVDENGLILSEYGVGAVPNKWTFPARNRIVSGLSLGVIVVEAPVKSGALITADFALEHNRSVMAVPGDIDRPMSTGCNTLLKKGAVLVTDVNDVLIELGLNEENAQSVNICYKPENNQEEEIIRLLKEGKMCTDELADKLDFDINVVISTLNILVIKGVVSEIDGGRWILVK